ncbi:MAG: NDP-sugar synthase [Chloroflexi bacterium]|nr:NDP-sugar synthase [Chloroflexota bacterium]
MDAIILVGGQGTRLRPLTARRHKSLVPVCNRPAISYLFDWLARSGFERAVLALGRDNEDLAAAYPAGRAAGMELAIVQERERLESGGAIRNAVREAGVDGRFAVLNGDVFIDFEFKHALAAHEQSAADLTLALYPVADPAQFGVAVLDERSMVTGFVEKPPPGTAPSNLVNAGVWVFEPGLVDEIPPGAVRVEETLFPSLVARRRPVLGYRFEGLWADIGTPARYLELNRALVDQAGANVIAGDAVVDVKAAVDGSCIGPGSIVGASRVTDSVLWEHVRVGDGARISDSVLAEGVTIGDGAVLTHAVVGSNATISAGATVPPGASVDSGARYDGGNE